jgi:glycosyltransferase involved in cell wall biosynthesis
MPQELSLMTHAVSDPAVSLIIPVYNGGEKFRACLDSVKSLDPPPAEIIVVADGDTDGSRQLAAAFGARVIRRSVPGGPALARNEGARLASGDLLFFADADVTLPIDAIGRVKAAFWNNPGQAALIGSYDDAPMETNFLSQYKNLMHHYVHQTSNRAAGTFWGACGAIRREVFMTLGGFDERYRRPSIEDIELGCRLKKAGHQILLEKELQVKHLKHWGVRSLLTSDFLMRALPWTELILNAGRMPDDLNLKLSSRVSVVAVFLLVAALAVSPASAWMLVVALFSAALLLRLNWGFYRFLIDRRGRLFALKAVPWHWFYFLYCGLAFSWGLIKKRLGKRRLREAQIL